MYNILFFVSFEFYSDKIVYTVQFHKHSYIIVYSMKYITIHCHDRYEQYVCGI